MYSLDNPPPLSQARVTKTVSSNKEESMGAGEMAGTALEFTLGNICRGIGYGTYHVQRIPGVKQVGHAAATRMAEGYKNAQRTQRVHQMCSRISADRTRGFVSEETIVSMCRDAGFTDEEINRVLEVATQDARDAGVEPKAATA